MAHSQNGWAANSSGLMARYKIAGTSVKVVLRRGDVSVVLLEFLRRYNAEVEKLRQSDTGGYAYRRVRGASSLSNHASGTAVDVCWRKHPLGASGTYSVRQIRAVRHILADFNGVLRWGRDYRGRKDPMHFEINKGSGSVRAVANKFRARHGRGPGPAANKPAPVKPPPVVKMPPRAKYTLAPWPHSSATFLSATLVGMPPKYVSVEHLQRKLYSLGYRVASFDGRFGPILATSVKAFQKANGLTVDGKVGPLTWNKLRSK